MLVRPSHVALTIGREQEPLKSPSPSQNILSFFLKKKNKTKINHRFLRALQTLLSSKRKSVWAWAVGRRKHPCSEMR